MPVLVHHWDLIYRDLGIPLDYPVRKGFPRQREAVPQELVAIDHGQRLARPVWCSL